MRPAVFDKFRHLKIVALNNEFPYCHSHDYFSFVVVYFNASRTGISSSILKIKLS